MTLHTRTVRLRLLARTGAPLPGARVRAQLSNYQVDGADVVPLSWDFAEDQAEPGTYVASLWPNTRGPAGTQYLITADAGELRMQAQMHTVTEAEAFAVIYLTVNPQPWPPAYPVVTAVAQARGSANDAAAFASIALSAAQTTGRVFTSPAAGVDPLTGVPDGSFFSVRSLSSNSYLDEFQNVGGIPVPTGKFYPTADGLEQSFIDLATSMAQIATAVITNHSFN